MSEMLLVNLLLSVLEMPVCLYSNGRVVPVEDSVDLWISDSYMSDLLLSGSAPDRLFDKPVYLNGNRRGVSVVDLLIRDVSLKNPRFQYLKSKYANAYLTRCER